jgi:hypothetical protein
MLRLLIKDITVEKPSDQKQLLVHIRWQGGACTVARSPTAASITSPIPNTSLTANSKLPTTKRTKLSSSR